TCCEKMTTKTSVASLRSTGLVSTGINGRFHLEHVADFTGIKTNDIINHVLKSRELRGIEERLAAIEKLIAEKREKFSAN
ncbi:MAG: hypothetical protein ACLPP9_00490, partial [Smithella sp.]